MRGAACGKCAPPLGTRMDEHPRPIIFWRRQHEILYGRAISRRQLPTASVTHFLVKLVLAAPASFFSVAEVLQDFLASLSHFFKKLVRAAPASFFSVAWPLQVGDCACAMAAMKHSKAARVNTLMVIPYRNEAHDSTPAHGTIRDDDGVVTAVLYARIGRGYWSVLVTAGAGAVGAAAGEWSACCGGGVGFVDYLLLNEHRNDIDDGLFVDCGRNGARDTDAVEGVDGLALNG